PRPAAPAAGDPARQRPALHAGGRPRAGERGPRERQCGRRGERHGHRDPAGRARARLRALLPRRRGPHPLVRWRRARALDRPPAGGRPRRQDHGRQPPRPRQHVHRHAAARLRPGPQTAARVSLSARVRVMRPLAEAARSSRSAPPAGAVSVTGRSETTSPDADDASTQSVAPGATATSMAPDTLRTSSLPRWARATRTAPDTVRTVSDSPSGASMRMSPETVFTVPGPVRVPIRIP